MSRSRVSGRNGLKLSRCLKCIDFSYTKVRILAPQPASLCFSTYFCSFVKCPRTRGMRGARSCLRIAKTQNEDSDFRVCLCRPISVSRFHKRASHGPAVPSGNNAAIDVVKPRQKSSARESECGALVSPNAGNTLKQPLDRHGSRLTTFDDRLNDVGRKVSNRRSRRM
jgi:hypothetical protein